MQENTVAITPRGEDRIRIGHPWVYRSDIAEAHAEPGATVRVVGPRQRPLGYALYSDRSEITLRMLTRASEVADPAMWQSRIAQAVRFRESLRIDATASSEMSMASTSSQDEANASAKPPL